MSGTKKGAPKGKAPAKNAKSGGAGAPVKGEGTARGQSTVPAAAGAAVGRGSGKRAAERPGVGWCIALAANV